MAGQNCSLCPLVHEFPAKCIEEEPRLWFEDAEEGTECSTYLLSHYGDYVKAYELFRKDKLPYAGGWAEQPAYWIEAIEIFGAVVAAAAPKRPAPPGSE